MSEATASFDAYDYTRALERVESFFWSFCDDYLELVKLRAYGEDDEEPTRSARAALAAALSVLQRLLAPFLPFATEEAWRWWHEGSVHLAPWPRVEELGALDRSDAGRVYRPVTEVLEALRRAKSTAKVSPKAPVARCDVVAPDAAREALLAARGDLCGAAVIAELHVRAGAELAVEVTLGEG